MVCLVFRRAAASRFLSIATFSSGILRCAWCFAELPQTLYIVLGVPGVSPSCLIGHYSLWCCLVPLSSCLSGHYSLWCAWCFAELPWTYFLDRPYYLSECQAARHSVDIIVTVAICACHLSETQTLLEARLGKLHIKGIIVSLLFPQPTPLTP